MRIIVIGHSAAIAAAALLRAEPEHEVIILADERIASLEVLATAEDFSPPLITLSIHALPCEPVVLAVSEEYERMVYEVTQVALLDGETTSAGRHLGYHKRIQPLRKKAGGLRPRRTGQPHPLGPSRAQPLARAQGVVRYNEAPNGPEADSSVRGLRVSPPPDGVWTA